MNTKALKFELKVIIFSSKFEQVHAFEEWNEKKKVDNLHILCI